MRITLRQLRVFEAVARQKSVSKGAEEVHLSQSAASMALKELEEGLRVTLFHRNGKQLSINENGRRIQPMVRSLLAMARDLEEVSVNEPSGILRVCASTTIGDHLLGKVCADFTQRYPDAMLKLQVVVSGEVIRRVESMSCDVGLIESPCNRANLTVEPLAADRLMVFAAPDHPLVKKDVVTVADLRAARWCLADINSYTRQMLTLGLGEGGLEIAFETDSSSAIKEAVIAGLGLGCLSAHALRRELVLGEVVAVEVEDFKLERGFNLLMPKLTYKGALQDRFVNVVRDSFGRSGQSPLIADRLPLQS